MPQVFISYAWEDGRPVAEWLYTRFNQLTDWSAWMDREIHADSLFSVELQRRINEADLMVVVLTPGANRLNPPSFVQRELGYATQPEVGKPVYAVKALPTPVPLIIWGVTYVEFLQASAYETAFADLLSKTTAGATRRDLTPRQREEAYLRQLARDEINRRAAKFYAEPAAQAQSRLAAVSREVVDDPEAAALLAELAADIHTQPHHSPDDDPQAQRVEDFEQLSAALAKYPRVALIGDPGSGKTTTLRRLAYTLGESAAADKNAPLPIYVPLGSYDGGDLTIYIDSHFGDLRLRDYLPAQASRLVVLLDGLNETAQAHLPTIETWLQAQPTLAVRLTCRKLDYVERELNLQRIDVQPLDHERILQFMAAYRLPEAACQTLFWKLAGATMQAIWEKFQQHELTLVDFFRGKPLASGHPAYTSTTGQEDEIYNAMLKAGGYPGLLGLVRNPFLLTITISIYAGQGDIPANRAGLFAAFVRKLFTERGRPAAEQQGLEWLEEAVIQRGLTALAYAMQEHQMGTGVPYEWAQRIVAVALPGHDAEHVLYLAASAGIIDRGRELRFVHQLLQEYFAAAGMQSDLAKGVPATRYFPGEQWWEPTGWEETVILLAGLDNDATTVVQWLTPVQPDLAYRCATDSGVECDPAALQALYEPAPNGRRSPYAVAEWGRLNHEWDDRPGVGLRPDGLPDIAWCDVPAGKFLYGDDQQEREIRYSFKITKYPVTYRQFQAFIASGEFDHPQWWAGFPEDYRPQPLREQHNPYHNHPRDTVSWYQAVAFSRWLDARYRAAGLIGEDVEIRLPLEAEWEYAARGTDGREYPWGDGYRVGHANINEDASGVGPYNLSQTTAVGMYPQGKSPFGVQDMSGNLWEWCLNKYRNPNGIAVDGSGDSRVLRGGSFVNNHDYAAASFRNRDDPHDDDDPYGFRVVLSAPSASLASESLHSGSE